MLILWVATASYAQERRDSGVILEARLTTGKATAVGLHDLELNFYDQREPDGRTLLDTQNYFDVEVINGNLSLPLDYLMPVEGGMLWVEIGVRSTAQESFSYDPALLPVSLTTPGSPSTHDTEASSENAEDGISLHHPKIHGWWMTEGEPAVVATSLMKLNGALSLANLLGSTDNNFFSSCPSASAVRSINSDGTVACEAIGGGAGDDLGNHTATQNLQTSNHWISNDGNSEGIWIDGSGRVGIGTSSLTDTLHLAGNLRLSPLGRINFGGTTATIREEPAGQIRIEANDNTNGRIRIDAELTVDISAEEDMELDSDQDIYLIAGDDISLESSDHILMDPQGNVGIGQISNPTRILTIQQSSATDPIADGWDTYSSRRWKTEIEDIASPIEKILALRGVTYELIGETGRRHLGLIAEEVGAVIPEVVVYEPNGIDAQSIAYGPLVALVVEAMQEQQLEIERLRKLVDESSAPW